MKLEEMYTQIDGGQAVPAYLLHGTEELIKDEAVAHISATLLPEGLEEFNLTLIDAQDFSAAKLEDAVSTLPLMADKRLVLITHAEKLQASQKSDAQLEDIRQVMTSLPDSVCVVLVARGNMKADKLLKLLSKVAKVIKLSSAQQRDRSQRVTRQLKDRGIKISSSDADYMQSYITGDLLRLEQETDKLAAFVGKGGTATRNDITVACLTTPEHKLFRMLDDLIAGNQAGALAQWRVLMRDGQPSSMVISLLERQMHAQLRAHDVAASGLSMKDAAAALKTRDFVLERAQRNRRDITVPLRQGIVLCADLNHAIRTGKVRDEDAACEELILQLAELFGR